ncbi:MAG: serine dehydrogenasease [Verrucomicrobiota bacterium]
MSTLKPVDHHTRQQLNDHLAQIEQALEGDVITIIAPMVHGLDLLVKRGLELFENKRPRLIVILDTLGGVVEVVERMVVSMRHHYDEVYFVIPDRAMSAGTVFAMSGDKIYMNYFSCLGPIDPQIEKDGKLVPALAYLVQFRRLSEKADAGNLNTAEYTLLGKLDLGELHQFEQAKELSHDLLVEWLSNYKFKDWMTHSSTGDPVTDEEKRERANAVASDLNNNERWHSHGRSIFRDTLVNEIRLKIDNLEGVDGLNPALDEYFGLLKDYMAREALQNFIHTREYF